MGFAFMSLVAATQMEALLGKIGLVLLAVIVVGFLLFGIRDLARLSWVRISAISSVCFDESIRRRVLWITPLAIVGAVVVSQLQNAVDPQDAIRQTTKICLFTTGLVVTLVAIILASTNLQKEIETRVIYTIVTKPTTRLEIVLGKIWGFAKVSAAILLIMGVFTYAYLHVRAWRLGSAIASTLQSMPEDAITIRRATLEHYRKFGLLNAKAMAQPVWMQVLARPPVEGEPRWMAGGQGQRIYLHFSLTEDDIDALTEAMKGGGGLAIVTSMHTVVREPTESEFETIRQLNIPTEENPSPSTAPATAPTTTTTTTGPAETPSRALPVVGFSFLNTQGEHVVTGGEINNGNPVILEASGSGPATATAPLSPKAVVDLAELGNFTVIVEGRSPGVEYGLGGTPVVLQVINGDGSPGKRIEPLPDPKSDMVVSSLGRYGQQLVGGEEGYGGVAAYRFEGVKPAESDNELLTFEVKVGIERGGEGLDEMETIPEVQLRVRDPKTGAMSDPQVIRPETNRISYVSVPRSAIPADGTFDLLVRVLTPNQWLGVQPQSIALATGSRSFPLNLAKSLLILWMMSILVIAIALFCSTFVSWPIAVVLTLIILLGRWGVEQIGDAGGPGIGATMTGQTEDAIKAKLVRTSVDTLAKALTILSAFLPNITSFEATTDIERGISVPLSRLGTAGWVLLSYGGPMVILAYLILKRKEVAP